MTSRIKVGHTGTLDPLAEGVLIVCLGKATKIIPFLKDEKEYVAQIRLGQSTETDDAEGVVISHSPIPSLDEEKIKNILKEYEGEIDQTPPLYSAVRIKGQRSYHLARKRLVDPIRISKEVRQASSLIPKPRKVNISQIELLKWEKPNIELKVICSSGTYIRSLARDIGERLGCGGHLAALKRTRVGKFKIEDSFKTHESPFTYHQLQDHLISMNSALDHLLEIVIPDSLRESVFHGNFFPLNSSLVIASSASLADPARGWGEENRAGGWENMKGSASGAKQSQKKSDHLRILTESGELLAIGKQKGDEIHPLCVLV
jgi:tRNA pseudouridine55 synthase